MDTGLVFPHRVTPLVCGDLRVAAFRLEVLGRMPRPDWLSLARGLKTLPRGRESIE